MANKTLHSLQFPGLSDVYKVPEEAQEFSSSSTYAVGQFVTYQGVLYKCTTAVTTAGSWTGSTNWSVTDVGTELQVMQSNYYTKNYIDTYMAPLDTPTFTGVPKAPTAAAGTNTTQIATTAFVEQAKNTRVPVYGLGKNLLRNWYFGNPVNQRGQTSYTGGTYSIDAWKRSVIAGSEVTVASGYVTFGPANASNSSSMQQSLEVNTTKRFQAGCTVTASLLLNDGTLCYGSFTLSAGTTANNIFVTTINGTEFRVSIGGNRDNFNIVRTGSKVNMVAVKLELGSEQTLCHNEGTTANPVWVLNEIPDYERELLRCQTSTADGTDPYANKVISVNIPNKNLLNNWYFVGGGSQQGGGQFPINQRGATSYTGAATVYDIDSWKPDLSTTILEIQSNGINLKSSSSSQSGRIIQYLENPSQLLGKQLTISLIVDGNLQTATGTVPTSYGANNFIATTNAFVRIQPSTILVRLVTDSTTGILISAIKLELGSQQTLAHLEGSTWVLNEIPNYEEEYYRCITSNADSADTYANQKVSNITVQCNSVGSSSLRYYNNLIQSTHKVLDSTFSNPAAQTSDITVTTYDGYLDFSNGFASGATTNITLVLGTSGPVLSTSTTAPS